MPNHQPLTQHQIADLTANGCSADDWGNVQVTAGFDAARVRNVHFTGAIRIGAFVGPAMRAAGAATGGMAVSAVIDGRDAPPTDRVTPGIYNAHLINCALGDNVRIANVGVHVANYDIAPGSSIENVGTIQANGGATFGNGVEVEALNEAGGREVIIFNDLSSQFAHLLCVHRYRPKLIEKLCAFARAAAAQAKSDRGSIGPGARITNAGQIIDVNIGPHAVINGAASLVNGTILSTADAPTTIGPAVVARDFIVGESSSIDSGAMLAKTFVGQGCQIGKQFSAENCLFFANCEAFHGEAASVFAGPYTVTHHKSTLLIAGLFSFYNAGSGTNQSNHMYKLGPVHEGKLERGCKTGSFSYLMWPCRVGPFSVVLGKHTRAFDTSDLPFSFIEPDAAGRPTLLPGLNLATVGTVRDGAKWPSRDRRQGGLKRDRVSFDVLSPLTVGRMIASSAKLKHLHDTTGREVETVNWSGALIKRVLLRTAVKFYRQGIEVYLLEKVVARLEAALLGGTAVPAVSPAIFSVPPTAVYSERWVDIGGQLMPAQRLEDFATAVESGRLPDLPSIEAALGAIAAAYADDEWAWVKHAYAQVFEGELDGASTRDLTAIADQLLAAKEKFLKLILVDAGKEFDDITRTGFGSDAPEGVSAVETAAADFKSVRGAYDTNKFVRQIQNEISALTRRVDALRHQLSTVSPRR